MKLARAFILTAMLALAAMAFAGSDLASAHTASACLGSLVKVGGEMRCQGEWDPGEKQMEFVAGAIAPKLEGTLSEACGESNIALTVIAGEEVGTEGAVRMTELSFAKECKPCSKVEVTGLPYTNGKLGMPTEAEDDFLLESRLTSVVLSGCPLGVTCKFGTKSANLEYAVSESLTSNEFRAEGVALKLESGSEFCGSVSKWVASYVVSAPAEWWFALH